MVGVVCARRARLIMGPFESFDHSSAVGAAAFRGATRVPGEQGPMARGGHLLICRQAMDVAVYVETVVRHSSRRQTKAPERFPPDTSTLTKPRKVKSARSGPIFGGFDPGCQVTKSASLERPGGNRAVKGIAVGRLDTTASGLMSRIHGRTTTRSKDDRGRRLRRRRHQQNSGTRLDLRAASKGKGAPRAGSANFPPASM